MTAILPQAKLAANEMDAARAIVKVLDRDGITAANKIELRHVHVVDLPQYPTYVEATVWDLRFDCTMGHGYCWLDEDGDAGRVRVDLAGGLTIRGHA